MQIFYFFYFFLSYNLILFSIFCSVESHFIMASWKDSLWFQILLLFLGAIVGEYMKNVWMVLTIIPIGIIIIGIVEYCTRKIEESTLPIFQSPQSQPIKENSFFGFLRIYINAFLSKVCKY